jgi:HAD superfamily hydrolase (TIGR01509 family)
MIFADCSAVILDLDGLVLDTEKTYFIAWQKAAERMGFELTSEFCSSLSGLQFEAVEQKLLNLAGDLFQIEQFRHLSGELWYQYVEANGIDVKKGFHVLMGVLQRLNIPYCLATNSYQKNALECLAFAGVSHLFPVLVARDQVKSAKPAPDIFLKAATQLGKVIENCVVVEDSLTGIQAAKNAGAYVVYIPSSPLKIIESPDLILDDLAQLAELIANANCQC